MLHSLRTRLALSHAIPVLIFVALLGTILLYQLERTYFLDNLAAELAAQGAIIAAFTRDQPQIWHDPILAQFVLEQLQTRSTAQIMLVDTNGRILAASWFDSPPATGQLVASDVVFAALQGQSTWSINNNVILRGQIVDVAVPVSLGPNRILGAVRLSHNLQEIQRRLAPLRTLVWVTVGLGATLSLLIGLALAQSVAAPLRRLADIVSRFRPTAPLEKAPESGPTEIRMLAEAINQMGARLVELESSRTSLLTGIVHELSRPLGAIKAAAQTIRNNPDPALALELAAGIDDQIDQMSLQVEDLALLGELEYKGLRMNVGPIDVGEVVEHQSQQAVLNAKDRAIDFTWTVSPTLPIIQGDPKRIAQILDNLIYNALKYTPAGGAVHVEAFACPEHNPSHVNITVSDNGPGIALAEQERIFQFFYRSPTQQRRHQGMGIGLALARQLAEGHGGTLTVTSLEGEGATFTLSLPLKATAATPTGA